MPIAADLSSLHLSTAQTWRGGENQLFLLAKGLTERGEKALVVAPPDAPLLQRCAAAKVRCAALKIRGGADLPGAWKLARLLRKERPAILHAHDAHAIIPAKLALLLAGNAGPGIALVAHRRTVFKIKSRGKYAGRVNRTIAISNAARQSLLDAGVPEKKISVVYSGMDFAARLAPDSEEARDFRKRFELPAGAFIIAHAAALTPEKRQREMLEALKKVNARLAVSGRRALLVIAGTGELEAELRAYAQTLGVSSDVRMTGFQSDLSPLWANATVALFASEAEGLCTALIEAQGAGVPALISRAGGMPEVIEDEATGGIFEIGDVEGISRMLLALFDEREHCRRMGENAAVRARALFSSDAMVKGVLDIYQQLEAGVGSL